MMKRLLLIACFAFVSACGGDPIVGSWRGGGSVTVAGTDVGHTGSIVFHGDRTFHHVMMALNFAGAACLTTLTVDGTYTDDGRTLSVTTMTGTSATSGCADSTLNQSSRSIDANEIELVNTADSGSYSFSGNNLRIVPVTANPADYASYTAD